MSGFFDRFLGSGPVRRPLDRNTVDEVRALLRNGRKIQAVKTVREHTGMGLAEAKGIVDAVEEGRRVPVEPAPGHSLADRTRELLSQDRVSDAVLMVSRETGMTESEAARFIDALDR